MPLLGHQTFSPRMVGRGLRALVNPYVPVLAQVVVTRRCNLSCGYCNEYDEHSAPVSTETLTRYIDHLADLGTTVITLTGGETLLHPELDTVIRHVVARDMVCTSISNGFLLTQEWIERLNDAGLKLLQISVDNLAPNDTSQKSMTVLRKRLPLLKQYARFDVNINAVLGSCPATETRLLAREVRELGFFMTVGLLHGHDGMLDRGLLEQSDLEELYTELNGYRRRSPLHSFGEGWEHEMISTGQSDWKCRAGARYLYIDEFGKVSFCSQRRGEPGIPLLSFTREHARVFSRQRKGCELGCTIACVRRASSLDRFRSQEPEPDIILSGEPVTDGVA
ncbi:MAG TPA: radical SAM protein [candidate division Zixibacteria bacterium]